MHKACSLALALIPFVIVGCSRFGEGDKLFVDVTEGGIDRAAYLEATVLDVASDQLTVTIDALHCEAGCDTLPAAMTQRYRTAEPVTFAMDAVQAWETGKQTYEQRLGAYREFTGQQHQRGALFRVDPALLVSTRQIMRQAGFTDVIAVIDLAEFEQPFFLDETGEKSPREILESLPEFLTALRQRLKHSGRYETLRRLQSQAELAALSHHPDRLTLTAAFHELEMLQRLYLDYLLPKAGADQEAMALHFRYIDNALIDRAGEALADFYSDDCAQLPAGQSCAVYRSAFKQDAMRRLITRLKENLAQIIAAKPPLTERQRAMESMALFRFVLNVSARFPNEPPLLGREDIDRLLR